MRGWLCLLGDACKALECKGLATVTPQKTGKEHLQVPLNRAKFQKYYKLNVCVAGMGLGMVVLTFAGFIFSLYSIFSSPILNGWWLLNGFLSLWLVAFISLATVPAWQVASVLAKVLRCNLPALVIDEQGIQDNSSNYVFGFIPWNEIDTVSSESRYAPNINKTFTGMAIKLKNKQLLLTKKPPIFQMWLKQDDEVAKKCWVFIPQGRIEMAVEEVVRLANQIKAQHS